MLVAVDLLVVLEHTLTGAGTHEVVVALAGCQAAAHRGTCLVAALASLFGVGTEGRARFNKMSSDCFSKVAASARSPLGAPS